MARSTVPTAPGQGPSLRLIGTGYERVPIGTNINVGTWGYRAGAAGTPALPAGARVLSFSCVGGAGGGTVTISGGDAIPVPEGMGFGAAFDADVFDPTIVFTGTTTYFLQFVVEPT